MLPREWELQAGRPERRAACSDERPALGRLRHAQRHDRPAGSRCEEIVARCAALRQAGHRRRAAVHHRPRGVPGRSSTSCWAKPRTSCRSWSPTCGRARLQPRLRGAGPPGHRPQRPSPRWDLIDLRHYVTMAVQFSRGCPFDCEFCDIIVMNGRVPRTKTPGADDRASWTACVARGWNGHGLHRGRQLHRRQGADEGAAARADRLARAHAAAAWASSPRPRSTWPTTRSCCDLMVRAGFKKVFVGIETPSRREPRRSATSSRTQRRDLVEAVQDHPARGPGGHGRLHRRLRQRPAGHLQAAVRVHPALRRGHGHGGPAHARCRRPGSTSGCEREGRLEAESTGNNTDAVLNFKPKLEPRVPASTATAT